MRVDQAIEECHRWARDHADQGQELLDDLYRRQLEVDIKFRGQPISTFLRPVFLSHAQRDLVSRAAPARGRGRHCPSTARAALIPG